MLQPCHAHHAHHANHANHAHHPRAVRYGSVLGPRFKPLEETGYRDFTLGFAFNSLFDFIPSRSDGAILYFDCEKGLHAENKLRNFTAALTYIKHYPACTQMDKVLGISDRLFYQQVMPTIFSMAEHINFLDPQIRLWEYNHCEHFHERVTSMCDGYPVVVSCSSRNRFVQRLLKSGKCVPRRSSARATHATTMSVCSCWLCAFVGTQSMSSRVRWSTPCVASPSSTPVGTSPSGTTRACIWRMSGGEP